MWAVGFGGVGALLTRRRPGHPVGWIFAAAGMLAAADYASFEYALAAVVGHRDLPAGEYAGWSQLWIWVPFVALITVYLPLLFPDGRLPGPRWRPAVWAAAGCGVIAATGLAITPGTVANLTALRNPLGVHPAALPDTAIAVGLAGLLGCVVLAVWSLLVRARRGTSAERQQIKWLACAGCLVAATLAPSTILSLSTGTAARLAESALMIAIVTVPVAVRLGRIRSGRAGPAGRQAVPPGTIADAALGPLYRRALWGALPADPAYASSLVDRLLSPACHNGAST